MRRHTKRISETQTYDLNHSYTQENVVKYDTALNEIKQKAASLDQRCTYCELHQI